MIVAEQVVAALEGGLVTNALNIPIVGAEDLELLGPYIPLAAKLGRLAVELAGGHPRRIALSFNGAIADHDTRLLTVAALNGAFQGRVEQAVNYVNAPVIAAERGIEVSEERSAKARDYTSLVTVAVDDVQVSGTIIGPEHRHFLAGAFGFAIDLQLSPRMVFFRYDDIPGVIGRVGTMFGESGVNIANMAVSRTKEGGKALMALSIDSEPPPELVQRIRGRASTMPDSSRSDGAPTDGRRGGGWVVAQTVLMVVFVVLVFLPPYWPRQLSFVGVPLAVVGAGGLVWAARALGKSMTPYPRPRETGELIETGPYRLRPAPDLRGRDALLPRGRAVVERARDPRRARPGRALVAEGGCRGRAPDGAFPRVRGLSEPRSQALDAARIAREHELARDGMPLLDDGVVVRVLDDGFDATVLVTRDEQEGVAVLPDALVLLERRPDAVRALRIGALADEIRLGCIESLRALRDPLVHLAEERLGPRDLLDLVALHCRLLVVSRTCVLTRQRSRGWSGCAAMWVRFGCARDLA